MIFEEKYLSTYSLLTDQISLSGCLFTLWDIGQHVYCSCLLTRLWRLNFEISLMFLIKPFLYMIKSQDKNLNIIFNGFSLRKTKPFLLMTCFQLIWSFENCSSGNWFHCVKCVKIQSYFWSAFSCIWTEYRNVSLYLFISIS